MPKKILVVEDDKFVRELIVELLRVEGFAVSTAKNGKDAMEVLDALDALAPLSSPSYPDLILMDLMMPVMDGYEFRSKQLKKKMWSSIPTIAMSAEINATEKIKSYNLFGFLRKPVELSAVLNVVSFLH